MHSTTLYPLPSLLLPRCTCGAISADRQTINPRVVQEVIKVDFCTVCRTGRQVTETRPEDVRGYYEFGYHADDKRHAGVVHYRQRYANDRETAKLRLAKYRTIVRDKLNRILDVGAANGAFVDECVEQGLSAVGVEPDESFNRNRIFTGWVTLPELSYYAPFSVITYHDVLEHCVSPIDEMRSASDLLDPDGTLIVDVPHVQNGHGDHHYKREHLWYFSAMGLEAAMLRAGFSPYMIEHPIPGKLVVYAVKR